MIICQFYFDEMGLKQSRKHYAERETVEMIIPDQVSIERRKFLRTNLIELLLY